MALSGEDDKEMRIPVSYDPLENIDHHTPHHIPSSLPIPPTPHHVLDQSRIGSKSRSPMGGVTNTTISTTTARLTSSSSSTTATGGTARYRECLKNHAASTGGNVTDGCGEFMPSGEDGTLEALKCAACDCHRNFHRKESLLNNNVVVGSTTGVGVGGGGGGAAAIILHPHHHHPQLTQSASMNHHHHHHHQRHVAEPIPLNSNHWTGGMVHPVKMAFGGSNGGGGGGGGSGSGGTDSSSEELNFYTYQSTSVQPPPQYVLAKKRFRTKFTPDQKEKMMAFAEKLGWRIPREDDTEVQRFCAEVGVKRQVFKVWMHNNKNNSSSGKKNPDENNNNNNHEI